MEYTAGENGLAYRGHRFVQPQGGNPFACDIEALEGMGGRFAVYVDGSGKEHFFPPHRTTGRIVFLADVNAMPENHPVNGGDTEGTFAYVWQDSFGKEYFVPVADR